MKLTQLHDLQYGYINYLITLLTTEQLGLNLHNILKKTLPGLSSESNYRVDSSIGFYNHAHLCWWYEFND